MIYFCFLSSHYNHPNLLSLALIQLCNFFQSESPTVYFMHFFSLKEHFIQNSCIYGNILCSHIQQHHLLLIIPRFCFTHILLKRFSFLFYIPTSLILKNNIISLISPHILMVCSFQNTYFVCVHVLAYGHCHH